MNNTEIKNLKTRIEQLEEIVHDLVLTNSEIIDTIKRLYQINEKLTSIIERMIEHD